jgi:hypothetical protein
MATVSITGDRTANFDLCLALTVFSSEGSFVCHTLALQGSNCNPCLYISFCKVLLLTSLFCILVNHSMSVHFIEPWVYDLIRFISNLFCVFYLLVSGYGLDTSIHRRKKK